MCFTPGVLTCVFDEGSLSGEVADLEGLAVKDKQFVADYKLMAVVGGGDETQRVDQGSNGALFVFVSHVRDVTLRESGSTG